mgnify:FL=1
MGGIIISAVCFILAIVFAITGEWSACGGALLLSVVSLVYYYTKKKNDRNKLPQNKIYTALDHFDPQQKNRMPFHEEPFKADIEVSPHNALNSPIPQSPAQERVQPAYKTEHHHVTGTSHYRENIESLAVDNPFYDSTKKELIDDSITEEKVYLYDFPVSKVDLIEEPENPVDKNAIKVICDGVHIGYIKKGSCSHVKNLLHSNRISNIGIEIYGGKYKCVYEDYDDDEDDIVYTMETGDDPYHGIVKIKVKQ